MRTKAAVIEGNFWNARSDAETIRHLLSMADGTYL